jgi:hypothetical protein
MGYPAMIEFTEMIFCADAEFVDLEHAVESAGSVDLAILAAAKVQKETQCQYYNEG